MNLQQLFVNIIRHYQINEFDAISYARELERIKSLSKVDFYSLVFPYPYVDKYSSMDIEVVRVDNLPKVNYNGKDLYFPESMTDDEVANAVRLLLCEQDEQSPHRYRNCIKGKVLLDIGCAEGNYSLTNLENVEEIHMFDELVWHDCIHKTFKDNDNVIFHEGFVGRENPLDAIEFDKPVTDIKIDVEGMEYEVLVSGIKLLQTYKPRLQVCTYHKKDQFVQIHNFLKSIGYRNIQSSNGYMIFPHDYNEPPYFRNGVLYASW